MKGQNERVTRRNGTRTPPKHPKVPEMEITKDPAVKL